MITITITGADGLQRTFEGKPAQIQRAASSANARTANKLKGDIANAMAEQSGLKRSLLAKYRVFARNAKDVSRVWAGFNQVKAAYVKPLRPALEAGRNSASFDWGASAGQFLFPGSFVARMLSGHVGIFRRRGRSRLQIDEQGVNLTAALPRIPHLLAGLNDYWGKRFAEALNFNTNILPRGDE